MKAPIRRLFGLVTLLFAILVGFTSYWSVFEAEALRDHQANRRDELQEQRIRRGVIRTADGRLIAGSERQSGGRYRRRYPQRELFGHPVGYAFTSIGRSELEQEYNDELTGRRTELVSVFESLLSRKRVGQDLETTLDARVQRLAMDALLSSSSGKGAVAALDVRTGAVRALVSAPSFDPNDLDNPRVFRRLNADEENTPLFNRATQGLYPPGSTFKVVTAAAALDTGRYTAGSPIDGRNNKVISGKPLQNFGGQDFGTVSLTDALTHSVNTAWAEVGEKVGDEDMYRYMRRFGFYKRPPIDLPSDALSRSGVRDQGDLIEPTSERVDLGRMAIGQERLLVTPLQMAEVAAAIANGGVRMEPYLVEKAFDEDGRTTIDREPEEAQRVMSAATARELTAMMKRVVDEGTGTAAALAGVNVAGKTGTAELTTTGLNDLWFIGFSGDHAVAVMIERAQGGTGGEDAAPIAKAVLEALE